MGFMWHKEDEDSGQITSSPLSNICSSFTVYR